jgi:hypothetical protein
MAWQEMPVDRNVSAGRAAGQLSRVSHVLSVVKPACLSNMESWSGMVSRTFHHDLLFFTCLHLPYELGRNTWLK